MQEFAPRSLVGKQSVFEHLGIARAQVVAVERLQELSIQQYETCLVEYTYLVLQATEVNARLASHRSIDHGQQCSGNIDEVDAPLKGRSSKASKVGNHAATQIDEEGMAGGLALLQALPHVCE